MPDSVNPYIPGQPVEDPDLFFGRREILTSIREHLVKGRRVSVVAAAARMGKTSLLRQVPHHLPDGFCPVHIDLRGENAQRVDWLLWRVAVAIVKALPPDLASDDLGPDWGDFEGRPEFLVQGFAPRLRAAIGDLCLLLLIDDVDSLVAPGSRALVDGLLDALASWRDRDAGVAVVAAVSLSAQDQLLRDYPRLFGGTMAYVLGPLNSEEATRLITWPVDGLLTYDLGVARRIIEVTSGQPYYLQLLCFEIFNRCAPAGWVNQRDVDVVVEELTKHEIPEFRQVWEESSGPEQAVLAVLTSMRGARGVATALEVRTALGKAGARPERNQVTMALERLAERGVLERLGALSYRFRVALLRDWLAERLELREVVRNTRWDAAPSTRPSSGPEVSRLTSRRRRGAATPSEADEAKPAEDQEPARVRRWPWLCVAGAVVVAVVVLAIVLPGLSEPAPVDPAPSGVAVARATQEPGATGPVASATQTPLMVAQAGSATAAAVPTEPPTPAPALTPSPTPPLVVARPVPAIAYQSRPSGEAVWSLYVMGSDGGNHTLLAEAQGGFLSPPSWSPDGSQIAFVSDRGGNPDIWVTGIGGGDPVNLTQHEAKDHSPAWSHDGEWIAFASLRDALYWELYVMRADGSEVQRLTWWEDASDLSPTWSPDDTRLAFASKRDGNWEIYAMDRDGSNLVRLTEHPDDDTNPAWAPEGSRIAFESTRDGYADIFVMPVSGGEPVNVSNAPFSSEHGPTWSPDGGRIAFYSDRDGEWDIYVMGSDGSDVAKLTGDDSNDQVPAWRP
ncbi:MAG: hypothetical protein M8467_11250 [Anaerolineae bacterium]|nr:hypothetical protein [Anaerolineae bacterium]